MSNPSPNFEKFAFSVSPAEQQEVDSLADGRKRLYVPTGEEVHIGSGKKAKTVGQLLPVYTTEHPDPVDRSVVVRLGLPWSDDGGRPENYLWDAYLAHALQRTVVTVNTPGIDSKRWDGDGSDIAEPFIQLSPNQIQDLKDGRFRSIGEATIRALLESRLIHHDSESLPKEESFVFYNTSMGQAITGAGLRAALNERIRVVGAALGEGVNYDERNPIIMMAQFIKANSTAAKYLAQNPDALQQVTESMGTWLSRVNESKAANYKLFRALAKGRFRDDLGSLDDIADAGIQLHLSRGTASRLSPAGDFEYFANMLASHEARVDSESYENDDHGYTMTVGFATHAVKRALSQNHELGS